MTQVRNNAPHQNQRDLPSITLTPENFREVKFSKPCLDDLTTLRKVDDGSWQVIARNTRFPYTDSDQFDHPVHLEYHIKSVHSDGTTDDYYLKASLRNTSG